MNLDIKKAAKGRKISLPWFRQSSVQKSHTALSRQHTIDNCTAKSYEGSRNLQVSPYFHFENFLLFHTFNFDL